MDAYGILVAVAALIVTYGLFSGAPLARYVTGPMVFTAAGFGIAALWFDRRISERVRACLHGCC